MFTNNTSKARSTVVTYERIAKTLLRRAERLIQRGDLGVITDPPRMVAFAYLDVEPTISAASARLYRAAAVYWIQQHPGEHTEDAMTLLCPEPSESDQFHEEDLALKREALLSTPRGSQQKAKWLEQDDWQRLFEALAAHTNPWSGLTRNWLLAGLLTGLRPCEWRQAAWLEPKLTVQNAKATNGRSHGRTRTLNLVRSAPHERLIVEDLAGLLSKLNDEEYQQAYDGVRNLLRRVARVVFKRRQTFPSLYTPRHVFAARAKSTYKEDWVAALMGHASPRTAQTHYARASHARNGRPLTVEPSEADIDAVRQSVMRARQVIARAGRPAT